MSGFLSPGETTAALVAKEKAEAERQDRLQAYWQAVEASAFVLQCARTLADQLGMDIGMHDAVMCLHERLWQDAHKLCHQNDPKNLDQLTRP